MKWRKGPRPWPIHLFAFVFILQGAVELVRGLGSLDARQLDLQVRYPAFDWNQDWVIVWLSAWFSIVLIPVIAVWLYASRLARILLTLMGLFVLPRIYRFASILLNDNYPMWHEQAWVGLIQNLAIVIPMFLLFTESANHWFDKKAQVDPNVFS